MGFKHRIFGDIRLDGHRLPADKLLGGFQLPVDARAGWRKAAIACRSIPPTGQPAETLTVPVTATRWWLLSPDQRPDHDGMEIVTVLCSHNMVLGCARHRASSPRRETEGCQCSDHVIPIRVFVNGARLQVRILR